MSRGFSGLRAWLLQRLSAIYVALFLVVATALLLLRPPSGYEAWREVMAAPAVQLATALFAVTLTVHAWIGLRDVVLDYVKPAGIRVGVLALVGLTLIGSAIWILRTLVIVNIQ